MNELNAVEQSEFLQSFLVGGRQGGPTGSQRVSARACVNHDRQPSGPRPRPHSLDGVMEGFLISRGIAFRAKRHPTTMTGAVSRDPQLHPRARRHCQHGFDQRVERRPEESGDKNWRRWHRRCARAAVSTRGPAQGSRLTPLAGSCVLSVSGDKQNGRGR